MATPSSPVIGKPFHTMSSTELSERFSTAIDEEVASRSQGLAPETAQQRLQETGPNCLTVSTAGPPGTPDGQARLSPAGLVLPSSPSPLARRMQLGSPLTQPERPVEGEAKPLAPSSSSSGSPAASFIPLPESAGVPVPALAGLAHRNEVGDPEAALAATLPRETLELLLLHIMGNLRVRGVAPGVYLSPELQEHWEGWLSTVHGLKLRMQGPFFGAEAWQPHHCPGTAKVTRHTPEPVEIPAEELVCGDLVTLRGGDVAPADLTVVQATGGAELILMPLCGVLKSSPRLAFAESDSVCGFANTVPMGSVLATGSLLGVVTARGEDTTV
eukprot:RCo045646